MGYIQFEDVHKSFGNNEVLKGITMGVEKGHMATLLGPSGCGKSTLLRCLAGLEEVTSGKVYVDGKDITDVTPRNRNIGMVFQQYSLFPNMSVYQNVAFGLNMQKSPKDEVERKVKEMLRVVGLEEKIDQYPAQLSGGQQQRVALARAVKRHRRQAAPQPADRDPQNPEGIQHDHHFRDPRPGRGHGHVRRDPPVP